VFYYSYKLLHKKTRQIVERTFGIWKRRFSCLSRGLTNKLICSQSSQSQCSQSSITIVVACALLHNFSLIFNDVLPEEELSKNNEMKEMPIDEPHWQPRFRSTQHLLKDYLHNLYVR